MPHSYPYTLMSMMVELSHGDQGAKEEKHCSKTDVEQAGEKQAYLVLMASVEDIDSVSGHSVDTQIGGCLPLLRDETLDALGLNRSRSMTHHLPCLYHV